MWAIKSIGKYAQSAQSKHFKWIRHRFYSVGSAKWTRFSSKCSAIWRESEIAIEIVSSQLLAMKPYIFHFKTRRKGIIKRAQWVAAIYRLQLLYCYCCYLSIVERQTSTKSNDWTEREKKEMRKLNWMLKLLSLFLSHSLSAISPFEWIPSNQNVFAARNYISVKTHTHT